MKSISNRFHSGYFSIGIVALSHMVNDLYIGALAPILPLLVDKLDLTMAGAGGFGSIQTVAAVSQPLFGYLSDRWFGRAFLFVGPLMAAFGMGGVGLAPNSGVLLALLVVAGLGASLFHPPAAATANAVSGSRKGLGVSIFLAAGSVGRSLGPLLIAAVVTNFGLEKSWLIAIPAVVIVVFASVLPAARSTARSAKPVLNLATTRQAIGGRAWPLLLLWLIMALRNTTNINFRIFLPLLLDEQGKPIQLAATLIAIYFFAGAGGVVLGGYITDRFGPKPTLLASVVIGLPFFYLTIYGTGLIAAGSVAVAGISLMSAHSVCLVVAQEMLPDHTSTVSGIMMGVALGFAGITAPLVGWAGDQLGLSWALNLLLASLLLTIPIVLSLPIPKKLGEIPAHADTF